MISKKKGLQTSHADFSVSVRWAPLELMGPLLDPLKPTALLKPMGPLKSMGPGVILPPCPPSRCPCSWISKHLSFQLFNTASILIVTPPEKKLSRRPCKLQLNKEIKKGTNSFSSDLTVQLKTLNFITSEPLFCDFSILRTRLFNCFTIIQFLLKTIIL